MECHGLTMRLGISRQCMGFFWGMFQEEPGHHLYTCDAHSAGSTHAGACVCMRVAKLPSSSTPKRWATAKQCPLDLFEFGGSGMGGQEVIRKKRYEEEHNKKEKPKVCCYCLCLVRVQLRFHKGGTRHAEDRAHLCCAGFSKKYNSQLERKPQASPRLHRGSRQ